MWKTQSHLFLSFTAFIGLSGLLNVTNEEILTQVSDILLMPTLLVLTLKNED